MFKSVRIQNFRQFKDLKLDDLAQINLITGKNSAGKTSLLEAVYLLDGPFDPSRTITIAQFRGIGVAAGNPELWDWLFHNRDTSQPINLTGKSNEGKVTALAASLSRGSLIPTIANGTQGGPGTPSSVDSAGPLPALVYEAEIDGEVQQKVELAWTNYGLRLDPDLPERRAQGFIVPEYLRPGHAEAVRLSRLDIAGQEGRLVEALRVVEPRLKQLKVLDFGEGARVYGDIGQHPLVPLTAMGQGLGRLLMIVAPIILRESSVYLIDEIADSFHHSTLVDVWRVIVTAAKEYSAQLFATTHSFEAIEAAVTGTEGHEGSLAFLRLDRINGNVEVVQGADSRLRSAVRVGFEIR